MRKTLMLLLATILLLSLVPTALAVSGEDVLCVTVENCLEGNEYLLLAVSPGTQASEINEDNLLFMDQYTADGAVIRPAVICPNFQACDIYIGGVFDDGEESPRSIGSYSASKVPAQTNDIQASAFENVSFTHVYLVNSVSSLGDRAFASCDGLQYIYIPASVTSIADSAFDDSPKVTIGCTAGSAAQEYAEKLDIPYVLVSE